MDGRAGTAHSRAMRRDGYLRRITQLFRATPAVALLGPRQSGKTTLARQYTAELAAALPPSNYFDLEDPVDAGRLENPKLVLEQLSGLVVIDEVQRVPNLFPLLRTLIDRPDLDLRFLILGSASRDLIRQSSETLAGRISFLEVHPFSVAEVGIDRLEDLWIRGGFPPAFLADDVEVARIWRESYVRTFLERDIPALGIQIPPAALRRLWLMLAHYHGQIANRSELGRSLGISDKTVNRYIDILSGTFMIRRLSPWLENLGKRQVKQPRLYFRDSGILHHFLGVGSHDDLSRHPKLGASWEGFALEETIRSLGASEEEAFFWAVHQQCELDLLIVKDGRRVGFEFKYADAPRFDASTERVRDLLHLDELTIVCPGRRVFPVAPNVRVMGLAALVEGA